MPVPTTKADLLTALDTTFAKLEGDLDRVPVSAAREPVLDGHVKGTSMSPADLLAYLIGWNQQVLTWHRRRAEGLPDELPAPGINSVSSPSDTMPITRTRPGISCARNCAARRRPSSTWSTATPTPTSTVNPGTGNGRWAA